MSRGGLRIIFSPPPALIQSPATSQYIWKWPSNLLTRSQ